MIAMLFYYCLLFYASLTRLMSKILPGKKIAKLECFHCCNYRTIGTSHFKSFFFLRNERLKSLGNSPVHISFYIVIYNTV